MKVFISTVLLALCYSSALPVVQDEEKRQLPSGVTLPFTLPSGHKIPFPSPTGSIPFSFPGGAGGGGGGAAPSGFPPLPSGSGGGFGNGLPSGVTLPFTLPSGHKIPFPSPTGSIPFSFPGGAGGGGGGAAPSGFPPLPSGPGGGLGKGLPTGGNPADPPPPPLAPTPRRLRRRAGFEFDIERPGLPALTVPALPDLEAEVSRHP